MLEQSFYEIAWCPKSLGGIGRYAVAGAIVLHLMIAAVFILGGLQPQGHVASQTDDAVLVDLSAEAPSSGPGSEAEMGPEQSAAAAAQVQPPAEPPELPPDDAPSKPPELLAQKVEPPVPALKTETAIARAETAPTDSDATERDHDAGGSAAAHEGAALALVAWQKDLLRHLQAARRNVRSGGLQGVALIAFTIDREGRLVTARVEKSSGAAALDQAALSIVKHAAPFSRPPENASSLDFTVPILFKHRS